MADKKDPGINTVISESRYRDIIDYSNEIFFMVDSNAHIIFITHQTRDILGYDSETMISRKWTDYLSDNELNHNAWDLVKNANFESDRPGTFIFEYLTADRKPVLLEINASPLKEKDGKLLFFIGAARDITERTATYHEILESEQNYRLLFENMLNGFALHEIVLDNEGNPCDYVFLEVNKSFETLLGIGRDKFLGLKVTEALPGIEEDLPELLKHYGPVALTGVHDRFELHSEALEKWYNVLAFSPAKGRFATVFEDISERKKAEADREKALKELQDLKNQIEKENIYLKEEIKLQHNFEEIVGQSPVMIKMLNQVELVSKTDTSVLVLGETGTGKELIARAIHGLSNRSDRPLVKVNCATLPENLIESELFGHEKGAFTGAVSKKSGRFELAHKGTIFLDEIGDLPLDLQVKLLRVLQEGEIEHLGGTKTIKVDVRVIAATNRDLEKLTLDKKFRQDLYYRLNVFPIISPPLRDRMEDLPVLVNHFIKLYSRRAGKSIDSISARSLKTLQKYNWPGNVRELENVIERSLILSTGNQLEVGDWFQQSALIDEMQFLTLNEYEKKYILSVLENCSWRIRGTQGAAEILGMKPTTLASRMQKLGIKRPT